MSKSVPPFLPHDIRIVLRRGETGKPIDGIVYHEPGQPLRYRVILQARDGMNAPWMDLPVVVEE